MRIEAAQKTAWIVAVLTLVGPLGAQDVRPMSRDQLLANQSKLTVTMALDRQAYLPGELAELTITIANPTSQMLDIPEPFLPETGGPSLLEKDRRTREGTAPGYSSPLPEPDVMQRPLGYQKPPPPSVQIGAGQSITRTFKTWNSGRGFWGRLIYGGSVPTWAGEYRLEYWGGQVDFRVMSAAFESITRIFLPEWEDYLVGTQGQKEPRQHRTFGFVLDADGKHYVCLHSQALPFDVGPVKSSRVGSARRTDMNQLSPYQRIGESDVPIPALAAESDARRTITIHWGSNQEGWRRMREEEWRVPDETETAGGRK